MFGQPVKTSGFFFSTVLFCSANTLKMYDMPSSTPIDRDQVLHIARLARLKLEENEVEAMTRQLGAIVDYMADLQQVDVQGVEPTAHVQLDRLQLRDDTPQDSLARQSVMAQAPEAEDGAFVVPPFVDES